MLAFLVTGVTGAGKSTIARRLRQWGHQALSLDADTALCGWTDAAGCRVPRPAEPDERWLSAHRWTWDPHRLDAVVAAAAQERGEVVWLCGYAANARQLADRFDAVFLLDIDRDTMHRRLAARDGGNDFGRVGATLLAAHAYYREFVGPWRRHGVITVDATRDVDTIAGDLLTAGAQVARHRASGGDR